MARVALPASKVRARRRRWQGIVAGIIALGVLALFGAAVWLSYAPFLRVDRVVVSGLRTTEPAALEALVRERLEGAYGHIFSKNNILLYPRQDIVAAVAAAYPQLRHVAVHAQDFSTLAVVVVEREPVALWCPSTSLGQVTCYFMDEDGIVYAPAPRISAPEFVAYRGAATAAGLPRQYLNTEDFHALSAFAGAVAQQEPAERVVGVSVDDVRDVRLEFDSGFVLIFPLGEPGGDVYERYALARAAEPFLGRALAEFEYLDLRFGDKLYYKERHE